MAALGPPAPEVFILSINVAPRHFRCLRGNLYGTSPRMPQALEYEDSDGRNPFASWFDALDTLAAAKVTRAIAKLEAGLRPDVKSVGKGVHEARIDFGPGYRVYFAFDGTELILLLGGGEKHGQNDDIAAAQQRWVDYKQRKRT
jgi:putative addiction module killer protein